MLRSSVLPAAQEAARLAEANLSAVAKTARAERERIAKAELAAKLLGEASNAAGDSLLQSACAVSLK